MTEPNALPGQSRPPWTECTRLATLDAYGILDTPREQGFDDVAALAAEICGTAIAVVNFIGDGLRDAMDPRIRGR